MANEKDNKENKAFIVGDTVQSESEGVVINQSGETTKEVDESEKPTSPNDGDQFFDHKQGVTKEYDATTGEWNTVTY